MNDVIYNRAKKGFGDGSIDWDSHVIKVMLLKPTVIEDCEDEWNESVAAGVTSSQDTTDKKVGLASVRLDVNDSVAANTILATEAISPAKNLTAFTGLALWIKSSVALNSGDLQLLLDDSANCASPLETLNIPAISANTWTHVVLNFATPANLTAVASIGLKMVVDKGVFTVRIDDVRTGYIPNPDHDFVSAVAPATNELSGTGYQSGFNGTGRKTLANRSVVEDDVNDVAKYIADNLTWIAIEAGTIVGAIVYKEGTSDADSILIAYKDLPSTVTNGGDISIVWHADGILKVA